VKVAITGIVTLNVGDGAILEGMMRIIRKVFGEDTSFVIYDMYGEIPSSYYRGLTFRKWLYPQIRERAAKSYFGRFSHTSIDDNPWVRFTLTRVCLAAWCWAHGLRFLTRALLTRDEFREILEFASADVVVSSGGTYLVENWDLKDRIFDYQLCLLLKRPLVFFTQSLGPFKIPFHRQVFCDIFEKSSLILLRDQASLENVRDLGVKNRQVHVTADAAFALANARALEQRRVSGWALREPPRIAVSVREWRHFKQVSPAVGMQAYLAAVAALSTHLIKNYHAEITFISTCQGISEYWTDDSKTADKVAAMLQPCIREKARVDKNFHGPEELAEMLGHYDLLIATRMHMAILALSVGTPVFAIAYEFKTQELFARLGQRASVQNIEDITSDSLIKGIDAFIESLPRLAAKVFSKIRNEHEEALRSGELMKRALQEFKLRPVVA
jgi:colanic acid/amylovoran biosynthesis protein